GFNTVELARLSQPSQLLTILLMITGGAPGSTAGGFKITTLAILLLSIRAVFRRRDSAHCFGRRLSDDVLRSASAIFLLYLLLFLAGGVLICVIDQISLMAALFESASAIGTVGLSLGGTAALSAPSRFILIFLMYFGRVGGLTLIYAVLPDSGAAPAQLPQERVIASWAPVAVTAMPRRAGALSQVTGVMPPASSRCPQSPQTVPKSVK
ncbi:MAG: TrkH family potassium uptake protein, partial [Sutterella sp.]|nr:TrkH family potassium uptake protein [Sutterella sp.]